MELYAEKYADMRIWYYNVDNSSSCFVPAPIPVEWVQEGVFIFLGRRQKVAEVNYDLIIDDLDRLLPIYRHVEGKGDAPDVFQSGPFRFLPGFKGKASTATVARTHKDLDMILRHNILQEKLYKKLAKKHGKNNVSVEQASGVGTSIDLVVRNGDEFWFYEIKTADSPRACLRQAVGQLLEYAFWPGGHPASRLVVVGENAQDAKSTKYLETLKRQFRLPITYEHLALE